MSTFQNVKLVHKGFAHDRTTRAGAHEDTKREKAFASSWVENNPVAGGFGVQPVLDALIPDVTPRDATVAATVVQWLGSEVGHYFLVETLAKAGYVITRKKN